MSRSVSIALTVCTVLCVVLPAVVASPQHRECGFGPEANWDGLVVGGDYIIADANDTIISQMMNLYNRTTGEWSPIYGPLFVTSSGRRVGDEVHSIQETKTLGLLVTGRLLFDAAGTGAAAINGRVNVSGIGLYNPYTETWDSMHGGFGARRPDAPQAIVVIDVDGAEAIYVTTMGPGTIGTVPAPVNISSAIAKWRPDEGWTRVGDPTNPVGLGGYFPERAGNLCYWYNATEYNPITVNTISYHDATNALYVGGIFSSIDGVAANHVAIYNFTTRKFQAIPDGTGLTGAVDNCCTISPPEPYVGPYPPTLQGPCANFTDAPAGTTYCCTTGYPFNECCDAKQKIGVYAGSIIGGGGGGRYWAVSGDWLGLGSANMTDRPKFAYYDLIEQKWTSFGMVIPDDVLSNSFGYVRGASVYNNRTQTLGTVIQNLPSKYGQVFSITGSGERFSVDGAWDLHTAAWNDTLLPNGERVFIPAIAQPFNLAFGPDDSLVGSGQQRGMAPDRFLPAIVRYQTTNLTNPQTGEIVKPAGWHMLPCFKELLDMGYASDGYSPVVTFFGVRPPSSVQPAVESSTGADVAASSTGSAAPIDSSTAAAPVVMSSSASAAAMSSTGAAAPAVSSTGSEAQVSSTGSAAPIESSSAAPAPIAPSSSAAAPQQSSTAAAPPPVHASSSGPEILSTGSEPNQMSSGQPAPGHESSSTGDSGAAPASGLSKGAVAGIVAGTVGGVILLGAGVWFFCFYDRHKPKPYFSDDVGLDPHASRTNYSNLPK